MMADDFISHYGVKRRSGRYPWGSGERPYQGDKDKEFKAEYKKVFDIVRSFSLEHADQEFRETRKKFKELRGKRFSEKLLAMSELRADLYPKTTDLFLKKIKESDLSAASIDYLEKILKIEERRANLDADYIRKMLGSSGDNHRR